MSKPSHDNENPHDDDFDFLSEERKGRSAPKENVDVFESLQDQTLEVRPAAKLPVIRQPVPISESGPNCSPAERALGSTKPQERPVVNRPTTDEFDDDFGFLDDADNLSANNKPAMERASTDEFGEDWGEGLHDSHLEYEYKDESPRRKPLWLAIAGLGVLAIGGFVAFQSGVLDSNSNPVQETQNASAEGADASSGAASSAGDTTAATNEAISAGTAENTVTAGSTISEQFTSNLARIEGLVANGEFETASAAIDALDPRIFGYGWPEFTALKEQILARDTGDNLEAEKQRLAAEAVLADQQRIAEEQRQAEDAQRVEEARLLEEARLAAEAERAEQARRAEEARQAEESRLVAEAQRAAEARLAVEAQQAEQARLAAEAQQIQEAREAEEARSAAEAARQAEVARQVEAARQAEEARLAAEAQQVEAARQAEEARLAAEAQQVEAARQAEAARLQAEARQVEEARLAEEARQAEAARRQQAADSAARAAQARRDEAARLQAAAERRERDQLEAVAAEQRADARRAASERAAQQTGEVAVIVRPSTSDREATDRLSTAATSEQGLVVQNRGISDSELSLIDRRLLAVKEAIRARNMTRLTALTNIDGARVQAFYQLFTNSNQIDVRVDGSRAQASVGVVVGTLQISRVFGNDGSERVVPANLRNFTLTTRRDGNEWSKFSW